MTSLTGLPASRRCFSEEGQEMYLMGHLHEAVTWCKICPAGWQATHWDIYNKEKSRLAGGNRFVFGGCCILLSSSMTSFVPCDSIMQRAH